MQLLIQQVFTDSPPSWQLYSTLVLTTPLYPFYCFALSPIRFIPPSIISVVPTVGPYSSSTRFRHLFYFISILPISRFSITSTTMPHPCLSFFVHNLMDWYVVMNQYIYIYYPELTVISCKSPPASTANNIRNTPNTSDNKETARSK